MLLATLATCIAMGCKKTERTAEEWLALSNAKLKEIETLVATVPCSKQGEAVAEGVHQACWITYFPVVPSIRARFDRLRSEYGRLSTNYWRARGDEGRVIDCFDQTTPIRIGCEAGSLLVYTALNLPIDEARQLVPELNAKIQHYMETVTCTGNETITKALLPRLDTDEALVVPVVHGAKHAGLTLDDFYNSKTLTLRIRQADGIDTSPWAGEKPVEVTCENGRPVFRYHQQ